MATSLRKKRPGRATPTRKRTSARPKKRMNSEGEAIVVVCWARLGGRKGGWRSRAMSADTQQGRGAVEGTHAVYVGVRVEWGVE